MTCRASVVLIRNCCNKIRNPVPCSCNQLRVVSHFDKFRMRNALSISTSVAYAINQHNVLGYFHWRCFVRGSNDKVNYDLHGYVRSVTRLAYEPIFATFQPVQHGKNLSFVRYLQMATLNVRNRQLLRSRVIRTGKLRLQHIQLCSAHALSTANVRKERKRQ